MSRLTTSSLIITASITLLALSPLVASAQINAAAGSDALCQTKCTQLANQARAQRNPQLQCTPAGKTVVTCPYFGPGGEVDGQCMGLVCKALTANGNGVDTGLKALGQILGPLLGKLLQQQPSSPSGSPSSAGASGTGTGTNGAGCTSYYPTSVPSSDPCAYYVPTSSCLASSQTLGAISITVGDTASSTAAASNGQLSADVSGGPAPLTVNFYASGAGTLAFGDGQSATLTGAGTTTHAYSAAGTFGAKLSSASQCTSSSVNTGITGSDLLNSLGGSSDLSGNVSDLLTTSNISSIFGANTSSNTNTNANAGASASSSATTSPGVVSLPPANPGGAQGNIQIVPNGATIVANTVDTNSNTAIAGFYGADTLGAQQPTSLVGQLCQNRPWAGSFLTYLIPPTFFDGLCQWQGYQVGTPPAPQVQRESGVTLTQKKVPAPATTTPAQTVQPKVKIWAVPAAVPLGARATIDWNTQGVADCAETSPDGSFSQNSLRGSSATVPLTGATTFTISCQAPDGTPVTDYVTVNIAI